MVPAKDNPFRSHRIESLDYRFPGFCWHSAAAGLQQMNWRGAILGPHGTGKTTLLIGLHKYLSIQPNMPSSQLWFVPRDRTEQTRDWVHLRSQVKSPEVLLIDGIERLSWSRRQELLGRQLFWRGNPVSTYSIIATTHRRLGLPIWRRCQADDQVLESLLHELQPQATAELLAIARRLLKRNGGNVRSVFWQLYELAANPHSS